MAQAALLPVRKLPPGPKGTFLIGHAAELARDWTGFAERSAKEYGDVISYRFLRVPIVQILHPDDIEHVLVRNAANFHKSRDYAAISSILGNGLLTSEGAFWQAQRQLIQPAFRHENIAVYAEIMAKSTAKFLDGWKDGETRDLHEEMAALTLDIVTKSLFGSEVPPEAEGIGMQIAAVMDRFFSQATLSFLLPEQMPLPKGPALIRAKRHLDRIISAIVAARRKSKKPAKDLLQMLLDARGEHGARMSDTQLRAEILTLFVAGHETTANALTWTWYLLSQNPEAEAKLHQELTHVLGGRPPGHADLPNLPFTEMVLKESLRLYPPAWGIGRKAIGDFEVGGYQIPAGTNVFIMQWITQRDSRFFPKPESFLPERWSDDPIRKGRIPRFAYFPFGGGPRVCIGAGFAMMEATLLLASIAQRYRLALHPDAVVTPFFSITLRPKHGMKMRLQRRA